MLMLLLMLFNVGVGAVVEKSNLIGYNARSKRTSRSMYQGLCWRPGYMGNYVLCRLGPLIPHPGVASLHIFHEEL